MLYVNCPVLLYITAIFFFSSFVKSTLNNCFILDEEEFLLSIMLPPTCLTVAIVYSHLLVFLLLLHMGLKIDLLMGFF